MASWIAPLASQISEIQRFVEPDKEEHSVDTAYGTVLICMGSIAGIMMLVIIILIGIGNGDTRNESHLMTTSHYRATTRYDESFPGLLQC